MHAILVISNPVSGDGNGRHFVQKHVLPLLRDRPYEFQETIGTGAAGNIAADFLRRHQHVEQTSTIVLVISGGDGTVHEVINGIGLPSRPIHLVICPQGTANALYSTLFPLHNQTLTPEYRLRSLHAFLQGRARPLTLTQTQLLAAHDNQTIRTVFGFVVTSTALHASILDAAELLRSRIPGIERFKVAAAENISYWCQSDVRLFSRGGRTVQIYNPVVGVFKSLGTTELNLRGPFAYFLSTVNVDRLEPDFEIAPLFATLPPEPGEMDLIVIRPLRDPSLQSDNQQSRAAFVQTTSSVLQEAYNQGGHITLRYQDGTLSDVEGPLIVEYLRCSGWEWSPWVSDVRAHIVCVDGTVLRIQESGKVMCEVLPDTADGQYSVYA